MFQETSSLSSPGFPSHRRVRLQKSLFLKTPPGKEGGGGGGGVPSWGVFGGGFLGAIWVFLVGQMTINLGVFFCGWGVFFLEPPNFVFFKPFFFRLPVDSLVVCVWPLLFFFGFFPCAAPRSLMYPITSTVTRSLLLPHPFFPSALPPGALQ